MIRLTKGERPRVLSENADRWTEEIVEKVRSGIKISDAVAGKYAHPEIKAALLLETREKCAYCESKIIHIAFGDIEHIIAKVLSPELAVEWSNLTIACDRCNQNKSNLPGVLDPYQSDPEENFLFLGPLVKGKPNSAIGLSTERVLKLNRMPLVERRAERIDYVVQMSALLDRVNDDDLRQAILRDLRACANDDQEYSAVVKACLHALGH